VLLVQLVMLALLAPQVVQVRWVQRVLLVYQELLAHLVQTEALVPWEPQDFQEILDFPDKQELLDRPERLVQMEVLEGLALQVRLVFLET